MLNRRGESVALGLALGTALGAAFDNLALGVALGVAFGAAFETTRDRETPGSGAAPDEDEPEAR